MIIIGGGAYDDDDDVIDYKALALKDAYRKSASASIQGVYAILHQVSGKLSSEEHKYLIKAVYALPNPQFAFEMLLQQTVNSYELAKAIEAAMKSPKYAPREGKGGIFSADPLTTECLDNKKKFHTPDHFSTMTNETEYIDKAVSCYAYRHSTKKSTMRRLLVTPRVVLDKMLEAVVPFANFYSFLYWILRDNGVTFEAYENGDLSIDSLPVRFEDIVFE